MEVVECYEFYARGFMNNRFLFNSEWRVKYYSEWIQRQDDISLIVMFENSNLETCLNFNFSDSNLGGCCMSYTNIYTAYINMWCQNIW